MHDTSAPVSIRYFVHLRPLVIPQKDTFPLISRLFPSYSHHSLSPVCEPQLADGASLRSSVSRTLSFAMPKSITHSEPKLPTLPGPIPIPDTPHATHHTLRFSLYGLSRNCHFSVRRTKFMKLICYTDLLY